MLELISLHLPKCAGSSFSQALLQAYGADAVHVESDQLLDPSSPFNIDPEGYAQQLHGAQYPQLARKRVVHGHLYIRKYDRFDAPRVTLLREPVERMISHYFFWKNAQHLPPHGLRDYLIAQKLSITEFARLPIMRYFYTRQFFRDVDMAIFDAIGDYRDSAGAFRRFGELIGQELVIPRSNENPAADYRAQKEEIMGDSAQIGELQALLKEDIAFYERWAGK